MNDGNKYYPYTSTQSRQSQVPTIDLGLFTIGLTETVLFYMVFWIIIFVIWVWSMIAMINLNSRFKYFLEFYIDQTAKSTNSVVADSRTDDLRNYQTREEIQAVRRAKIEAMKPRRAYLWIAIVGIPLLLIILALAPALFR
jgi:hypothetical protein